MKVLDLFSGIGGFSLGLEKAGWKTVAFCEINQHCNQILRKYWKDIRIFEDITKLSKNDIEYEIDVICGGFPCQDISVAGKMAGINGSRSGLWKEYLRLIDEIRPKYAIIENVANLRTKGLVTVLQDLSQIGYNAEWHCIPASAVGAPHKRDRIWIIAYPSSNRCNCWRYNWKKRHIQTDGKWESPQIQSKWNKWELGTCKVCKILSNSNSKGLEGCRELGEISPILSQKQIGLHCSLRRDELWKEESVSRLMDGKLNPDFIEWMMGFPIGWTEGITRKHRIIGLGNSLIPQIPTIIAKCIMEYDAKT